MCGEALRVTITYLGGVTITDLGMHVTGPRSPFINVQDHLKLNSCKLVLLGFIHGFSLALFMTLYVGKYLNIKVHVCLVVVARSLALPHNNIMFRPAPDVCLHIHPAACKLSLWADFLFLNQRSPDPSNRTAKRPLPCLLPGCLTGNVSPALNSVAS